MAQSLILTHLNLNKYFTMNNKLPACVAPWVNTYEWSDGTITPCCEWDAKSDYAIKSPTHMSFEERFKHPSMETIKSDLLTKSIKDIKGCNNCYRNELVGTESMRQDLDRMIKHNNVEIDLDNFQLLSMDYRESNVCNFSCKMCGPSLSSTHAMIDKKYNPHGYNGIRKGIIKNPHKLQMYLDQLDNIKMLNLLGGEPTLMDSTYVILNEIRKRGLQNQITMSIVTNASTLHREKDNLIPLLDGFKFASISISIDVVNEQHNYWRQKGTWDTVWSNIQELYEFVKTMPNNYSMQTRTALSWPTSYAARGVWDLFKENDMKVKHIWNMVTRPYHLCIAQLPQSELDKLVEHWKDYPDVQQAFKKIKSNPNSVELMRGKRNILRFDDWHKNSFLETFPEHSHMWNNIG